MATRVGDIIQVGDVVTRDGSVFGAGSAGEAYNLTSGTGDGAGNGGALNFTSGVGGATGDGGDIILTAGNGGATSGNGGSITLNPGTGDTDGVIIASGSRITQVGFPTAGTDAATKQYVDNYVQGLDTKDSVRVATTANITLSSAPATIDGITLSTGDRVLVKNQTNATENGIYDFNGASSAMTRSNDADNAPEVNLGESHYVWVEVGTANADTGWVAISDGSLNSSGNPDLNGPFYDLGTDAISYTQFAGAGAFTVTGGNGISSVQSGNDFTVSTDIVGGSALTNTAGVGGDQLGIRGGISGQPLLSQGTGSEATFGALNLAGGTNIVTGTLPVTNGGTGLTSFTQYSLLFADTTGSLTETTPTTGGATEQFLVFDDSTDTYSWVDVSTIAGSNGYGQIAGGDGGATATADTGNELITFNGDGINITTTNSTTGADTVEFVLDLNDLTTTSEAVVGTDTIAFYNGSTMTTQQVDVDTFISDLGLSQNLFETIAIGGNTTGVDTSIIADTTTDTATLTGGTGITLSASTAGDSITFTFSNAGMVDTAVTTSDTVPFFDVSASNQPEFRSWSDILSDLNIVNNITTNGIVVQTGPDTYEGKAVAASTVGNELGLAVTNGDGTSAGDIVVGLDITGQTTATPEGADEIVIYDTSAAANRKATVSSLVSTLIFRTSFTNASLVGGVYTANHNLGNQIVLVQVFDENNQQVVPDDITLTSTTALDIDLTSFGTIAGTWNLIVFG